jgi:hypothetical protein
MTSTELKNALIIASTIGPGYQTSQQIEIFE